ncbi:MAG: DUF3617 domain-containing protein [Gammaproteobacteria bacterium]|jgi:hypothetical protein
MERNHTYGAILASVLLVAGLGNAVAEPLNIKPGLWEMTVRAEMHGMPPIPEEQLKNLSPQQRDALNKMMAESSKPHTRKLQECITQQDLNKSENLFNSDQPGMTCNNKLSKHSGSGMSGTIDCTKGNTHSIGKFSYEAKDREHVTGEVSMTITNGKHTMTTKGTMSGRWLGSECPKSK